MKREQHLIFYDGTCGLCDHVVQFLLKHDKKEQFLFAPLQGETAKEVLKTIPPKFRDKDSLILIENYQTNKEVLYLFGKASFRILWLLGGYWKILGALFFLPSFLYNWGYYLVAKNRKIFFSNEVCELPNPSSKSRFLP